MGVAISLPGILSGEGGGGKTPLVPSLDETPDILDEYVIPWLWKWNVGAGLKGEQGAESLHTRLHSLERNFSGISNELDRLKHIFYMYNIETCPQLLN